MPRPHAAAVLEDAYNGRKVPCCGRAGGAPGWCPLTGYGSVTQLRVFGRVIMTRGRPEDEPEEPTYAARLRAVELETRGWRAFFATPAVDEPVTVRVNERIVTTRTDRGGYIDLTVRGHGLTPGWHQIYVGSPGARDHRRAGARRRHHGDPRDHLRHRRHRAVDVAAPPDDRGVEHVHAVRGCPPAGARDGDDVPRAAGRAPRTRRSSTCRPGRGTRRPCSRGSCAATVFPPGRC